MTYNQKLSRRQKGMENEIQFDFSHMMAENFTKKEVAVSKQEIENELNLANEAFEKVFFASNIYEKAIFDTVTVPQNLEEIEKYGEFVSQKFDNFVVLGVGGSALGARAIFSALTDFAFKKDEKVRNGKPKWFVRDSINPEKFESLLQSLDVSKTMFFCVTKSGGTLETLVQLSIVSEKIKNEGLNLCDHVCVITAHENSKLSNWAKLNNIKIFWFSDNLSGRFSVLSAVGLLPAASVGVDIKKLLNGAKAMIDRCTSKDLEKNPALKAAVIQKICIEKGLNVAYLMPYADSLKVFASWWCQLWAESLGKCIDNGKTQRYFGQTTVSALGTVDQHSQLQLCLEGIYDKTITFLTVKNFRKDKKVPKLENGFLDDYLVGQNLSTINNVSQQATQQALLEQNRVSQNIILDRVDEFSLGQLFMFFMLETMFLGKMFGFDIETYQQPSVELIKRNIKTILK